MTLLILGLALWWAAHVFKRLAPGARARMGAKGRGPVALILLGSVILMVIGYRGAEVTPLYAPVAGMGHLNNLLMIVALYLFGAGSVKGWTAGKLRHPMLTGAVVWAIAHLLVNGDVASLILFGGIGLWALVQMALINRAEGPWQAPAAGPVKNDVKALVIALVLFVVIAAIHVMLGHNPFLGSYA